MGAPDVLKTLRNMGLTIEIRAGQVLVSPRASITEAARQMIREHREELLAMVSGDTEAPTDPAVESRRQRVLALLAANPQARLAVYADGDTEGPHVPVAVAIRGVATLEVLLPKSRFDPFKLLELVERYNGASVVH